jgi:hypothetical protein
MKLRPECPFHFIEIAYGLFKNLLFLRSTIMSQPVSFNIRAPLWWLLIPLAQITLLALMVRPEGSEWPVFGLFIVITALASWRLFSDGRPYSLNKVWWLFSVVFLGIIPSLQLAVRTMPWHTGDITLPVMLYANGLILLCLGIYEGVRLWASRNFIPQPEHAPPPVSPVLVRQFAHLAPAIMLTCGMGIFIVCGFRGLFLRGHMEAALWKHGTTFQLLFDKGLRGTMLWCCLAAIVLHRQHKLGWTTLLLVLIPGLVFNFPLALPRYLALTVYLGWALAAGLHIFKRRHAFSVILLALFMLVAPMVSVTRYAGIDMQQRLARPRQVFQKSVIVSDYDAWSSLCRAMHYTAANGNTKGRQLMGVALFYVPRSVWPSKPIGSGAFLFNELGLGFNNVACTFLAEGYINFGSIGSIVFTALLALLIARYDGWYWRRGGRLRFTLPRLFYFVSIGMLFFILRGDLLSSVAYTVGFGCLFVFWQALFFWRLKRNSKDPYEGFV